MNRTEKSQYLDTLRAIVREIDLARNSRKHDIVDQRVPIELEEIENKVLPLTDTTEQFPHPDKDVSLTFEQWLSVAFLGLVRIWYVDTNVQLTKAIQDNQDTAKLVEKLKLIKERRSRIANPAKHTIHGDPINWDLEFAQDDGNTEIKLGNNKGAITHFSTAISVGNTTLHEANESHNSDLIAGIHSGIAVNEVRLGLLQSNPLLVGKGIIRQIFSACTTGNHTRTNDLIKIIGKNVKQRVVKIFKK